MKGITRVLVLSAFTLLFVSGSAFGQMGMRAGVKAGVDFANLGGDAEQLLEASLKSKTGFSAGAFFGFDLHRMFRLQIEGQYVQKGTKAEDQGVDVKIKLDYVEFMVPLTLLIPTEGPVTPRLYAGPAVGIEASCKFSGTEGGITVDVDCDSDEIGAQTKSVDFGVFFGGGVDFAVGPGALTLDVLYNLGLTNINDVPDAPESIKNQNIQVMAGYAFMLGG
jgi:hypothetical protein